MTDRPIRLFVSESPHMGTFRTYALTKTVKPGMDLQVSRLFLPFELNVYAFEADNKNIE